MEINSTTTDISIREYIARCLENGQRPNFYSSDKDFLKKSSKPTIYNFPIVDKSFVS